LTIAYRLIRDAATASASVIRHSALAIPHISGSFQRQNRVISGSFGGRFGVGLGSVYYHVIVMTETLTPGPATSYRPSHPTRGKKHAFGPRNTISSHDHPPLLSAKVFDEQRCASVARGERGALRGGLADHDS